MAEKYPSQRIHVWDLQYQQIDIFFEWPGTYIAETYAIVLKNIDVINTKISYNELRNHYNDVNN